MKLILPITMLILSFALTSSAQVGPESPCISGAKWHYKQASHWLNHNDQIWHQQAAESLLKLNELGDPCTGWEQDATRPGPNGNDANPQANQTVNHS